MPRSLDMFAAPEDSPTLVVLPEPQHMPKSSDPATIVMIERVPAPKPEEVHSKKSPSGILERTGARSRGTVFWREIRRMFTLALPFFLLLGGGNLWSTIEATQENAEANQRALFSQLKNLETAAQEKDVSALAEQLKILSNDLQASPFFFSAYAALDPENTVGFATAGEAATAILEAGTHLATAGKQILAQKNLLFELPTRLLAPETNLLEMTEELAHILENVLTEAQAAVTLLHKSEAGPLPDALRVKLQKILTEITPVLTTASGLLALLPNLRTLLGAEYPQHIIVLLQNSNELRPTGGFPGSFLEFTLVHGQVQNFAFRDIFEVSGQLSVDVPVPPEFANLTGVWTPHDFARTPDFPTAAEQLIWFFEHAKRETPDTVLAINENILEDILALTGPLELSTTFGDITLDSENAAFVLSYFVEAKIFGQGGDNSPKKILPLLFDDLVKKVPAVSPLALSTLWQTWTEQKDILAYSRAPTQQRIWQDLNISGQFLPKAPHTDFIGLVNSNVGGNKSDAFVTSNVDIKTLVNSTGELFHTLKITRQHTWSTPEENLFENLLQRFGSGTLDPETLKQILGAGQNKAYLRVYTPKGSRFVRAFASESETALEPGQALVVNTAEEDNATVFTFFFPGLSPSEEKSVELTFATPFRLAVEAGEIVNFTLLSQPGARNQTFSTEFLAESGVEISGEEVDNRRFQENWQSRYLVQ